MSALSLAPFRLRILFRVSFLMLAIATVSMTLYVLREEKQLSYQDYQQGLRKTRDQIIAKLRHPTGQLALLNPGLGDSALTPLHPFVLPFSSLDFDDPNKVQQAVEMAGCLVQYGTSGSVCVAIGDSPWAGGFIYVVGSFVSTSLTEHQRGDRDLSLASRLRIAVDLRGERDQWIAPFELIGTPDALGVRGRLTGFIDDGRPLTTSRPIKDFRGWLWQPSQCTDGDVTDREGCPKRSFFSVRLPVDLLREALFQKQRPLWPPSDLDRIRVQVEALAPGDGAPLLDSNAAGATPPFSLHDLSTLLLPGESMSIKRVDVQASEPVIRLVGSEDPSQPAPRWLTQLIRHLDVEGYEQPIENREVLTTPLGRYVVTLTGDVRSVNRSLSAAATRVSWFVGAMLLAILFAWIVIEIGIIRRITVLTRRAAAVSKTVRATDSPSHFNIADLRGDDELGVLATCLSDLLQRVKEDVEREHIRAAQEKDMWHAVGHEIMSPLQSLMALHAGSADASIRYISRMQQAVRVLYGSASPSEAFQSTTLQVVALDLNRFLDHVARNAPCVDIADVVFQSPGEPVIVRADEYSLEDVVTHVLRNADRYRPRGTPITISLTATTDSAQVAIDNRGEPIRADLMDKIFEYGVSDHPDASIDERRGQGLFVARTYMAKMGGTITAQNLGDGVRFALTLPRAANASL